MIDFTPEGEEVRLVMLILFFFNPKIPDVRGQLRIVLTPVLEVLEQGMGGQHRYLK